MPRPTKVKIIGGCWPQAIGRIGAIIVADEEAAWIEFDKDVVFEGADPETQHVNRAWFFPSEFEYFWDFT